MNADVKQKREGSQWRALLWAHYDCGPLGLSLTGWVSERQCKSYLRASLWGGESTQLFIYYLPAIISWGPSRGINPQALPFLLLWMWAKANSYSWINAGQQHVWNAQWLEDRGEALIPSNISYPPSFTITHTYPCF